MDDTGRICLLEDICGIEFAAEAGLEHTNGGSKIQHITRILITQCIPVRDWAAIDAAACVLARLQHLQISFDFHDRMTRFLNKHGSSFASLALAGKLVVCARSRILK